MKHVAHKIVEHVSREAVLANYKAALPHEVLGFFEYHRPLSNFHLEDFEYKGLVWPSSENAYQAAKTTVHDWPRFAKMTPSEAKKEGRIVKISTNFKWDTGKFSIMHDILVAKFNQCPIAKSVLMSTGTSHLEEANWWKDQIWGTVKGVGENNLGKTLMEIRSMLQKSNENRSSP